MNEIINNNININNMNNNINTNINTIEHNYNIIYYDINYHKEYSEQRLSFYHKYESLNNIIRELIDVAENYPISDDKSNKHFLLFLNMSFNLLKNNYTCRDNMSLDKIAYALTYICGTLKKFMYAFGMQYQYENYDLLNMFKYV